MSDFSIGEAAFSGLGLVRRQPIAVLVWGALFAAFFALVFIGFAGPIVQAIPVFSDPEAAKTHPDQVLATLASVAGAYLFFLLGALVLGAVIMGAVLRAVFEPQNAGFFYLRLGSQELWLLLVSFVQGLVIAAVQMVLAIPVGIVTGIVGVASHSAAIPVQIVGQILLYVVMAYMYLRFSMSSSMTFKERRFRLFESWAMTRGRVLNLFLVALLVGVMVVIIYFVTAIVFGVAGAGLIASTPGLSDPAKFFSRPVAQWVPALAPLLAIAGAMLTVLFGLISALSYAPFAHIYGRINHDANVAAFT